jgi:hypothetical protein
MNTIMSNDLVPRTNFTSTSLTRGRQREVLSLADQVAKTAEITKVANCEVAHVGLHALGTMASMVVGTNDIQHRLTNSGNQSDLFDDALQKILQTTGQNIHTITNMAQQEILKEAMAAMV